MLQQTRSSKILLTTLLAIIGSVYGLQGAAEPTRTGAIYIENTSNYAIIVQMLGERNTQVGASLRISKQMTGRIASNLANLQADGIIGLRFGHASDQYAGRTYDKRYIENPMTLTIATIRNTADRHGNSDDDMIITINEPILTQGRFVGGTYTWNLPTIRFVPSGTIERKQIMHTQSVYDLPMFTSIKEAAQEAKYLSRILKGERGTPDMLKTADPERWACLALGMHRPDFDKLDTPAQRQAVERQLSQRLTIIEEDVHKNIIQSSIAYEAKGILSAAAGILLTKSLNTTVANDIIKNIEDQITRKFNKIRLDKWVQEGPEPVQPATAQWPADFTCPICLETMTPQEKIVQSTACGHSYHRACIARWMLEQNTCPLCRQIITTRTLKPYEPK
jgi:hypothetical protein